MKAARKHIATPENVPTVLYRTSRVTIDTVRGEKRQGREGKRREELRRRE
jgi:hypothetical protein